MEKRLQKSNISPLDCKLPQSQKKYYTHTHTHTNSFIKSNVPGQPGLYRETLSRKTKTNEQKKKKNQETKIQCAFMIKIQQSIELEESYI